QRKIAVEIFGQEARTVAAVVGRLLAHARRPMPADQSARQDAVGSDCYAELAAGRQNLRLDAARDQRVLDLQIDDRVHRVRTPDRRGADLREADVAHVSLLDET